MHARKPAFLHRLAVALAFALFATAVDASVGVSRLKANEGSEAVTVFYPSSDPEREIRRGPFTLRMASEGRPVRGNGRLVVISHGSGGSPWENSDLARALVEDGFVVALPEHRGDNHDDYSAAGPESWKRRPAEVSRAIDRVATDPRFASAVDVKQVGVFGMSAGGHTVLTLVGGRWSPSGFKRHCESNIGADFHACVGLASRLRGNLLDGLKKAVARWIIEERFDESRWYTHEDARIAAAVAAVPYAADFDFASLAEPRVPLALVRAGRDKWLAPRFHGDRVKAVCSRCEVLDDLEHGGHGALLSPFPPGLHGLLADLLRDPPGFERARLPQVHARIAAFFRKHLLSGAVHGRADDSH